MFSSFFILKKLKFFKKLKKMSVVLVHPDLRNGKIYIRDGKINSTTVTVIPFDCDNGYLKITWETEDTPHYTFFPLYLYFFDITHIMQAVKDGNGDADVHIDVFDNRESNKCIFHTSLIVTDDL
jgi:hypothetical protein